jgi:hypothetical protein
MRTGLASTLTGSSLFSFQGTGAVQRRIPSLSRSVSDVKRFFSSPPRGGGQDGRLPCCRRILLAGKIGPGHRRGREDTEPGGGCQALFLEEAKKKCRGRRAGLSSRGEGLGRGRPGDPPATGPAQEARAATPQKNPPIPLRDKGFPPPHFPVPFGSPEGRGFLTTPAIPRKWDFLLPHPAPQPTACGQDGKVRRRPSTLHPPARSFARVAG